MGTASPTLTRPSMTIPTTEVLQIALVIPLQGPAGIFGPSCEACAQLAVDEINSGTGVLGRELRLIPVDGGAPPHQVANELDALISAGAVDAVTGWHISAVREAVAPCITGRVPYVYTALYEGGERTPGVFLTGETPECQLLPTMRWMAMELGIRQWCIIGDNYVWPWGSAKAARNYAERCGARILDEIYVELGTAEFTNALRRIESSGAQGVLMFLVGNNAVPVQPGVRCCRARRANAQAYVPHGREHAAGKRRSRHKGNLHSVRLLRIGGNPGGPRLRRPLYQPLRPGGTPAEQHGRILLRGSTSA